MLTAIRKQIMLTQAAVWKGLLALAICSWTMLSEAAPLMRYPTTTQSEVVFVAYNKLWSAPLQGGPARRLTDDPGTITAPRFSPDGRWVAYTSRRAGLADVYLISARGGEPTRLTHEASRYAEAALVVAWTPDSKRVVFLSHRAAPVRSLVQAFSVSIEGSLPLQLPLDRAGMLSYSPDGKQIAFNRNFRNLELRKRYLGGEAQDVYTYDFSRRTLRRLTHWKGTDTAPMWYRHKIYFLSDRGVGFRQNLWSFDLNSKVFRQLTHFQNYDIDWPALGSSAITFQDGGHLYALDLPSEHLREVKIDIPDDGECARKRTVAVGTFARATDAMGEVDYALSPEGDALLLSAHGDLFSIGPGAATADLTRTDGVDEDHPAYSPDGHFIAYTTDVEGEQQIALRPARGGTERLLTHFPAGYRYTPLWSAAGDSLVVADAAHSLWWVRVSDGLTKRIAMDPIVEIRDAAISPDGRWVAYSTERSTRMRAIHLHELATGIDTVVSSPMENDHGPVFTRDGKSLIFISARHEQMYVSDRNDDKLISPVNSDGLYAVPLDLSANAASDTVGHKRMATPLRVDLNNFMRRAVALPLTPAKIASVQARPQGVFYQSTPIQVLGGDLQGSDGALHLLDLESLQDRIVVKNDRSFVLSDDGKKVAFRRDGLVHG